MTDTIKLSIQDAVMHIEFNRPEKKNALTMKMYDMATEAIKQADTDPAVRTVVISGRGDCFTAGNDMVDFLSASTGGLADNVLHFLRAVPQCSKPIIAAVHGHAVGIGTTLLLHCDLVYAEANAKLKMPFVNLALCPEFGSSLLLPKLIGHRRASELLLLGETMDAHTALQYGIVNAVVDNCLDTAREKAQQLATKPAAAIRLTKQLLRKADQEELLQVIEEETQAFAARLVSPEAVEAFTAFMEKREPDFSQFD